MIPIAPIRISPVLRLYPSKGEGGSCDASCDLENPELSEFNFNGTTIVTGVITSPSEVDT